MNHPVVDLGEMLGYSHIDVVLISTQSIVERTCMNLTCYHYVGINFS